MKEIDRTQFDLTQFAEFDQLYIAIIALILFFWLLAIIRVAKDISARTHNHFLQIISILFVTFLTPILGLPLYLAIRPIWYKRDKTPWRDACLSDSIRCSACNMLNSKEYKCCIQCGKKLTIKCKECNKDYSHEFWYCPYCWAPNIDA